MPPKFWRLGYRGFLNDDANFLNKGMPDDRWKMFAYEQSLTVKPWRNYSHGSNIVLMMQRENDMWSRKVDIYEWAEQTIKEIKKHTDRPIEVRRHPKEPRDPILPKGVMLSNQSLEDDLNNAWAVVSLTSLSSIEAVMAGVPVFAMSPANMAYPVSNHDLSNIEYPKLFDRVQWLYDLSYTCWSYDEMISGQAWEHLKPGVTL
jgi:regulation of enolase protein 1 (concanavalin A-like superfamily)